MTSAPPITNTSLLPAASLAWAIASSNPFTNVNPAFAGASSGRCVTIENGTPNGLWPPHASAASYVLRPPTTAPTRAIAPSRTSLSAPVASPLASSSQARSGHWTPTARGPDASGRGPRSLSTHRGGRLASRLIAACGRRPVDAGHRAAGRLAILREGRWSSPNAERLMATTDARWGPFLMGETYAEAKQELEALLSALDQLRSENPGSALVHAVAAVRESLRSGRFTVVVAGEFKRGKTTFVNALLGAEILPAAVVPLTSVVTIVRWGEAPRAEVRLLDGRTEEVPVEDLASYVTERGNPANHRGVDRAVLEYPAESLRDGVILVDTPGVGSVYRHNTDAAYALLPEADAAIFLTSADPPISETERGFLVAVREESARMFFVLNKADYLTERDLAEAVEFTADVLREAIGREVQLYPVSARRALEAKTAGSAEGAQASGFVEFERDFRDFLLHEKGLVILLSGARRLRKVVIDEVNSVDVE